MSALVKSLLLFALNWLDAQLTLFWVHSNIATEGRTLPSLAQLDEAVRAFIAERPHDIYTVVVDATFEHRIDASERKLYDEALAQFEQWQRQPHLLDEQSRPKDAVAFQAKYNRRLAESRFPSRKVKELGLSFAATVRRLEKPALRSLLAGFSRHASS